MLLISRSKGETAVLAAAMYEEKSSSVMSVGETGSVSVLAINCLVQSCVVGVGVPCAEKMAARIGFASSKVMDEWAMKAWRNARLLSL